MANDEADLDVRAIFQYWGLFDDLAVQVEEDLLLQLWAQEQEELIEVGIALCLVDVLKVVEHTVLNVFWQLDGPHGLLHQI